MRLWQLKELRALPSPSAAELATRTTLEAGEAADEEAVAEKAQIKRMARGDLTAEEALAQAADEKLVLVTSANATGYKGVGAYDGMNTSQSSCSAARSSRARSSTQRPKTASGTRLQSPSATRPRPSTSSTSHFWVASPADTSADTR